MVLDGNKSPQPPHKFSISLSSSNCVGVHNFVLSFK